jgi:hypothetical protein
MVAGVSPGIWLLLTDDKNEPVEAARRWIDREAALSDLAGEGWDISGPYPRPPNTGERSWGIFQGYALNRAIH